MRYLVLVLLLLMSFDSLALTKTWNWTAVTEDTNDDPIVIEHYNVYCNDQEVVVLPGDVTQYARDLRAGTHWCYITAEAHGIESENSETKEITIIQAAAKRVIIIIIE